MELLEQTGNCMTKFYTAEINELSIHPLSIIETGEEEADFEWPGMTLLVDSTCAVSCAGDIQLVL